MLGCAGCRQNCNSCEFGLGFGLPGIKLPKLKLPPMGGMMGKKKDNAPAVAAPPDPPESPVASAPVALAAPASVQSGLTSSPGFMVGAGIAAVAVFWFLTRGK